MNVFGIGINIVSVLLYLCLKINDKMKLHVLRKEGNISTIEPRLSKALEQVRVGIKSRTNEFG